MISTLSDDDGKVVAYIEAWQVGQSGFPKFEGEYLWVHDLWIHEDWRGKNTLLQLVWKMLTRVPSVRYGYWKRHKYGDRISKTYKREQFDKICERMGRQWAAVVR